MARLSAFERRGLDAVDADARAPLLQRRGDAGDQPAAADADHDDVEVRQVLEQLEADRAVAGDDRRVVERVDEAEALRVADPLHLGEGLADVRAVEDDPGAVAEAGLHLRADRARRHHDRHRHPGRPAGPGVGLAGVPGRQRDDAARPLVVTGWRSGWSCRAA